VFDGPLSGWRDTGIQVFDAFNTGPWEHTYALMLGTGTGLEIYNGSGSGRPDWHLYWSSELIFSGKEPLPRWTEADRLVPGQSSRAPGRHGTKNGNLRPQALRFGRHFPPRPLAGRR